MNYNLETYSMQPFSTKSLLVNRLIVDIAMFQWEFILIKKMKNIIFKFELGWWKTKQSFAIDVGNDNDDWAVCWKIVVLHGLA